jgi:hypothetical protein
MIEEYANLGALAIVVLFAIQKVFDYMKTRKNGNALVNYEKELAAINLQLNNHYTVFCEDLREVRNDIKSIKEAIVDIKIDNAKK